MKKQRKQTEEQQPVNARRKQLEKRKRELSQLIAHCTLDEYQRLAAEYSDIVYALEARLRLTKKAGGLRRVALNAAYRKPTGHSH